MPPKRRTGKPPPYTEWHGNSYRAKLRIPEKLRFHFPIDQSETRFKRFVYENLRTDDPEEARAAALAFVDRMQSRFRRIARRHQLPAGLLSESQRWRSALATKVLSLGLNGAATGASINANGLQSLGLEQRQSEFDALVDRAYDLQERIGHARAVRFFNFVVGRTTAVSAEMEGWLRSKAYSMATRARYRKIANSLIEWCHSNRIPATIEAINTKRAQRFLSRRGDQYRKAAANERAALTQLWDWSNARLMFDLKAYIEAHEHWTGDSGDNPWRDVGAQASSRAKKWSGK
ncbi:hypothetical protein GA0061098_1016168 [Bradyrhizobium shewense]|uniref:Uncharacterized protein n=1 Tax=Bradyrhizobium shewense TaxID=1761772 RepID=A0A1C3XIK4_9BRAD|nr:hypothetical protein [Bradyrhizobium shewense]SCB52111.1 hypothetical protein GA0061098_1016168 [Bradyrhizobium shewense]